MIESGRRPWSRTAAALLCAGAGACASLPVSHRYAPEVTGVALRSGAPLAFARVRLSAALTNDTQVATTDERGRFTIGPLTDYRFTVKEFGVRYFAYTVEIVTQGRTVASYSAGSDGEAPQSASLQCDAAGADETGSGGCSPSPGAAEGAAPAPR
jgi:hypothetical protein